MNAIRVVLAEDQAMILGALAALLETETDLSVCARAANGRAALAAVAAERPDVLVTDIEMPEMTGLTLAAEVRARHPDTQVVILTTFARPGYLRRALDAGVAGDLGHALQPAIELWDPRVELAEVVTGREQPDRAQIPSPHRLRIGPGSVA